MEALIIELTGVTPDDNLGIVYGTHVQNIGWQAFVSNGAVAGTQEECLRLEAIKIVLTKALHTFDENRAKTQMQFPAQVRSRKRW